MKVPFYGHVKQYQGIRHEIDANIREVLESGQYVMGPMLKRFEQAFAAYHGMKYAVGVGNGTDALWLTFLALGIGPGDECITTPNTFFATAEAIWVANATAVFVDSDPRTNCIDPSKIEAAITPRTKALVPVHLYGQCADMKAIRRIADQYNLLVIEDNAQGIGAHGDGFRIGELSDAVCTSFIIQKNLGTFGDGGAVVTNLGGCGPHRPQAAQSRVGQAVVPQHGIQQPPGRYPRRRAERQAESHRRLERPAAEVGGPVFSLPEGCAQHYAALRDARVSARLSSVCHRDPAGGPA